MSEEQSEIFAPPALLYREPQGHYALWRVGGHVAGEAVLIVVHAQDGSCETALFDAGFAWSAPQTCANIEAVLATEEGAAHATPRWLALSHSHYDHVNGAGYLKHEMPAMQVYSHAHGARVFQRPGALKTMTELNDKAARSMGLTEYGDVKPLDVDRMIAEGDTLRVGDMEFAVLDALGHTRDSVAFWCAQDRLLVSSETAGVYTGPMSADVAAEYGLDPSLPVPDDIIMMCQIPMLVGYESTLEYIDRARALHAQVLLVPHHGVFTGADVDAYFAAAHFWCEYSAQMVCRMYARGCSDEEVSAEFKRVFYTGYTRAIQPEPAFDLNASYTIPLIVREVCNAGQQEA